MTTVGIKNIEGDNDLIFIYPNPSHGSFTIRNNFMNEETEFQITDLLGNWIYSDRLKGSSQHIVQLHLNAGIYFLQLIRGEKIINQKLIIQ